MSSPAVMPSPSRRISITAAALMVVSVLAGCGSELTPTGTAPTQSEDIETGALQGVGMVLESRVHGPRLCFGALDSMPPQCGGGPELIGWDWADAAEVAPADEADGTTWGDYAVTGTWDGERLTVTAVGAPEDAVFPTTPDPNLSSACPEPDGGWVVLDERRSTDDALQLATEAAAAQPDHAATWIDDAGVRVLNASFTGELERHETELRTIWGGALCVSAASRSLADLLAIQQDLADDPRVLGSGPSGTGDRLEVSVVVDDGIQAELDAEHGPGTIFVVPSLWPVS